MSSLPREVHEVLEHEYASMYGPLPRVEVHYRPEQIFDVQSVLSILRICDLEDAPLVRAAAERTAGEARELLARHLNRLLDGEEGRFLERDRLASSPALSNAGRALIEQYDDFCAAARTDEEVTGLRRRIIDDAFAGSVKPLRDLRLANVYAQLHARTKADPAKARTAFCISGGGIRSATFALGVIQGLATAGILDKFDYLSTVSGGGYIGSWLSSWVRRHPNGVSGVQEDLAACDTAMGGARSAADTNGSPHTLRARDEKIEPEPKPVRHLRDYSNYLTPRLGLLSADAWTTVALYLRNLLLNLLVIVPIMMAVLALPRAYSWLLVTTYVVADWVYPAASVICLLIAFTYLGLHRPVPKDSPRARKNTDGGFLLWFVVPLLLATISISAFWADVKSGLWMTDNMLAGAIALAAAIGTTIVPYVVYGRRLEAALTSSSLSDAGGLKVHLHKKKMLELVALIIGLAVAAALAAVLFVNVFSDPLQNVGELIRTAEKAPADRAGASLIPWNALYICFAVPALLLIFYIQGTIFVGITSHYNPDSEREWWGRGGAWLLATAVAWMVVSVLGVFGPVALYHTPVFVASAGGIAGVVTAVVGFSSRTPANKKEQEHAGARGKAGNAALGLATPVFAVFFLALISLCTLGITYVIDEIKPARENAKWSSRKYALDSTLTSKVKRTRPSRMHPNVEIVDESKAQPRVSMPLLESLAHFHSLEQTQIWEVAALFALAAMALIVSRFIGGNKFSMHALYRNRLIRAYLGASRHHREPHPFTGFDEEDDLQMYELRPELLTPANLHDPRALINALKEGARGSQAGLLGDLLGRCKLAQHFWSRLSASTRMQLESGRVPPRTIQSVVLNLNAILLRENELLEEIPDLGLPGDFWTRPRPGHIPLPPLLRNRAVLDHYFGDVITPMPRPKDVISGDTAAAFGDESYPGTGNGVARRNPLHVVNVTANLVSGEKLAWQQRKALPFTVTPYDSGSLFLGYRDSRLYGGSSDGISFGTAVTISGAAASPNMGYHSSPAMGFLLTLFNVRLGWWLGNPGPVARSSWRYEHPTTHLGPMFTEMVGRNDDLYDWVYLSDGGHFENLGLYEMVLRRCHYIILSDAGADPHFSFEDLGNAIRKIRTDLGVPIDIEEMFMVPRDGAGEFPEGRYIATATIRYTAVDGPDAANGMLIYIKPGIYQDPYLPRDVINYAKESRWFPHETLDDQVFSESQFESYRALGRHVINDICGNYPDRDTTMRPRIPIAKQFRNVAEFAAFVEDKARRARGVPPELVIAQAIRETRLMT